MISCCLYRSCWTAALRSSWVRIAPSVNLTSCCSIGVLRVSVTNDPAPGGEPKRRRAEFTHSVGYCRMPFARTSTCVGRSEEHTSELQSLMRISYAVFCLKKKNKNINSQNKNSKNITTTTTYRKHQQTNFTNQQQ